MKVSETPKRPRRLKTPIEPIHVEELLGGAGMSGFLGVLEAPVLATHLEKLARPVDTVSAPSELSARVESVVLKVEALAERIGMDAVPWPLHMQAEGGTNTK